MQESLYAIDNVAPIISFGRKPLSKDAQYPNDAPVVTTSSMRITVLPFRFNFDFLLA